MVTICSIARGWALRPPTLELVPRILRTHLPDGYFHVTARGVDGTAIFRDDHDRLAYLRLFALTTDRYMWTCHAFCLMDNHVHLVLDATRWQLSAGFQYLHGEYAQRFNNRHERTGHLFGARFASWVIDSEGYLKRTIEYVLNNPVRARLVDDPDDYSWSAARALSEHVFARYNAVPNGCLRRADRPRRPRAQPEGHHRPPAAERLDLHHRALRLREVEPCLRHDLRRGPAPLRRVALGLRAAVPPDDGEAGRRLHRRPQPGDLDRPEDHLAQPALHRRHRHGDLRLPPPAVRAHRPPPLPDLRQADRRTEPGSDRRPDPPAPAGDEVHCQRPGRPRPQGRVQGRLRGVAPGRLHAREGRRRAPSARGPAGAGQEVQAHDRGRCRPADHEGGPPDASRAVGGDRGGAGGRARHDRRGRRRVDALQREVRVSRPRRLSARAAAAHLLLQLAAWSLSALHRARGAAGDRPGSRRSGPDALGWRGRSCRGRSATRASTSR